MISCLLSSHTLSTRNPFKGIVFGVKWQISKSERKRKKKKTSAPWDTNVSKKADLNGNVRLVRLHSLSSRSHLQHQPTVYIWTFYYHHLWLWNNPSLTDLAQDFSPPCHPTNNRACDQNRILLFLFFTCCHQIPQRRNKKSKTRSVVHKLQRASSPVHKWVMYPERSRGPYLCRDSHCGRADRASRCPLAHSNVSLGGDESKWGSSRLAVCVGCSYP